MWHCGSEMTILYAIRSLIRVICSFISASGGNFPVRL